MASTFSDLKIELIGTGEQVGTWGSTTNVNLGTALEEAIVESADVAFSSADVTLTLTNTNGSQTARHLRLNLTGTSGGARQLILGSGCQIEKPYIINNSLADAVTVKNTAGTGIVVPAGKSMWVYNNGTNVVKVVNSVELTADVSGVLPVANGGTGITSLGTGVATALGQNVTGSGGMVLATSPTLTSPTLTTPVLGTPSSGTLTNCTGLPIEAGTTGTLSVARGGIGATTLTANNVLLGNGTSAPQFVAPGTSGNLLTSNGTTWTSAAAPIGLGFVTGMIMLWSGSIGSIPAGFALCNGSNGTPDLRNRFIVGAGSTYAVDATGGSADATLPTHTHTATSTVTDPGHFHTSAPRSNGSIIAGAAVGVSDGTTITSLVTDTKTTGITVATTNANAGTSGTNANLPPYYALAYIMKL